MKITNFFITCWAKHFLVFTAMVSSPTVVPLKKKKPGKNPDVDTSFLPDKEREVHKYDYYFVIYFM